jgi:hypothetical protein
MHVTCCHAKRRESGSLTIFDHHSAVVLFGLETVAATTGILRSLALSKKKAIEHRAIRVMAFASTSS